jgi:hypothetical protein
MAHVDVNAIASTVDVEAIISWLIWGAWRDVGRRVVNYKSATMRVPGAIRRAFLYVVFPIGLLWVAVVWRTDRPRPHILARLSMTESAS